MGDLDGRIALVTGASRGLGEATARALAAAGARVVVSDLAAPHDLADQIGGIAASQDVTREDDWVAVMQHVREAAGGLDILVNNAGVFLRRSITEMTLDEWRFVQSVNVEGVFLGHKHAIPLLAERAQRWRGGAAIVNLSSMAGIVGSAGCAAYNASKGAVRLLTKAAALELAPHKIRVNSVRPGVIETAMAKQVVQAVAAAGEVGDNEVRSMLAERHPMGNFGEPVNIADAVVFLASDKAAFMTGSELVVDGGFTAQ